MDEIEYRSTYQNINPTRCVFEKAINSRICNCSKSTRFNLADREGVSCNDNNAQELCTLTLQALRENARFVLQQISVDGQLPHNAEIKIQNGGIQGIAKLLGSNNSGDIFSIIDSALAQYNSINNFPYGEIVQEISAYKTRRKRKK
ncbi:MAG: hypothetical protein AAGB35_02805 [Pseudomonadota bacterium]